MPGSAKMQRADFARRAFIANGLIAPTVGPMDARLWLTNLQKGSACRSASVSRRADRWLASSARTA